MHRRSRLAAAAVVVVTTVLAGVLGRDAVAQGALAQLGLTEATARNFVLGEVKAPRGDRLNPMALAGTRAFLKLPPSTRGAAATRSSRGQKAGRRPPRFLPG